MPCTCRAHAVHMQRASSSSETRIFCILSSPRTRVPALGPEAPMSMHTLCTRHIPDAHARAHAHARSHTCACVTRVHVHVMSHVTCACQAWPEYAACRHGGNPQARRRGSGARGARSDTHAMPSHPIPSHLMPCHAIPCHAILCHAARGPCNTHSHSTLPCTPRALHMHVPRTSHARLTHVSRTSPRAARRARSSTACRLHARSRRCCAATPIQPSLDALIP